ncbi:MAG: hypothetical protein HFH14_03915 [Lachnospiraceae bacterium]|nr:hypothetical protein [Lachnospiraceae bacterium]
MKKKDGFINRFLCFVIVISVCAVIPVSFSKKVQAEGSINANEARVIAAARGTFEYNGETYVAKQNYVDQLINKLSSEDVDLTSEQADEAISAIYANVGNGVASGYIVKTGTDGDGQNKDDKTPPPEEGQKNPDNEQGNPDNKEDGPEVKALEVIENDDGTLTVEDEDGKVIFQFDGILKNTGFSYNHTVILIILLGAVILCVLIYSVVIIKDIER